MGSGASKNPGTAAERSVSAPPEVNSQRRHTLYPRAQTSQSAQDFRRKSTPSTSEAGTSEDANYKVRRDYTVEGVGYVIQNEGGPSVVLGFRPEGSSQITSISRIQESGQYELEMDTSRDLTLSRILSADEFLARMSETDQRISNFSAVSDQDQVYDQLKDLMGLRGHLQDELLRIQAMISLDDPSLNSLEEFAHIYPHVVARIRELAARAKVIEAVATGDTPTSSRGSGVSAVSNGSNQDMGVQLDPTIVQTIQQQVTTNQSEANANNGVSIGVATEEDLKEKHEQEERLIAAKYAKRLAAGGKSMPHGAREMILDQHLASMQALRTKQDQERKLFELTHPKMPKKPIAKVAAMPSAKDSDNESSEETMSKDTGTTQWTSVANGNSQVAYTNEDLSTQTSVPEDFSAQALFSRGSFGAQVNSGNGEIGPNIDNEAKIRSIGPAKNDANPAFTSHKLISPRSYNCFNDLTLSASKEFGTQMSYASKYLVNENTSTRNAPENKDFGIQTSCANEISAQTECPNEDFSMQTSYANEDLSTQTSYANEDLSTQTSFKQEDFGIQTPGNLVAKTKTVHFGDGSDDDQLSFANNFWDEDNLLKGIPNDVQKMKKQLNPEDVQNILDNYRSSEARRREKKKSENDKVEMALQSRLNKRGQHCDGFSDSEVDLDNSDSEDEELTDKDQDFIKKIKKGKKISQKEFDALLASHLANTAALRKQRKNEASRSDELLKAKLRSRSGHGEGYNEEDEETHAELEKLDETLRKTLAERRKDMSEAELQAMLAQYRKDRQQLLNKRGSEKAKHDDLLQKKLEENKRRRASLLVRRENGEATAEDLESMDDKFFQELQRKLKDGEISQEEFSAILKNYLNTIDSNQLKQKRLEQRKAREKRKDEDARNEASNLVHESLELKRQITSIRNREREAFDEQLRNKLAQKGKMSPLVE